MRQEVVKNRAILVQLLVIVVCGSGITGMVIQKDITGSLKQNTRNQLKKLKRRGT